MAAAFAAKCRRPRPIRSTAMRLRRGRGEAQAGWRWGRTASSSVSLVPVIWKGRVGAKQKMNCVCAKGGGRWGRTASSRVSLLKCQITGHSRSST